MGCTAKGHKALIAGIRTLEDAERALVHVRAWGSERPGVLMGDCPECFSSFSIDLSPELRVSHGPDFQERFEEALRQRGRKPEQS